MLGYLIAAPTLVAGARWAADPQTARAALPTAQPVDNYDLTDLLTDATRPTAGMISIAVNRDGTVSFALPRSENGQGITTACAMTIADEMDLPLQKVRVTLADARPELVWNQFTAGSNSMHSLWTPLRAAAATARGRMTQAAARMWGVPASSLKIRDGVIFAPDGRTASFGDLAERAAVSKTVAFRPQLKRLSDLKLVGTAQRRIEAHEIVTGRKRFAMDVPLADALPTMVCRPPTINGTALAVLNRSEVLAMPGVTDVVLVPHTSTVQGGVAVRAKTFGQCIDAIRALKVRWGKGPVDDKSADTVLADLKQAEVPLPPAAPGGTVIEQVFTFNFRPGDPLEPNTAVADVRKDRAEIWSPLKSPIWAKQQIAMNLGMPVQKVTVHVTEGGGSFGRRLYCDAAFEAAAISQKIGKPVRLMWHRTDNFRHGRVHPMAISRVRAVYLGDNVLTLDQRHTGVATDFTEGFGEIVSYVADTPPNANYLGYSSGIFNLTANVPYNFGLVSQRLDEVYQYNTFNTSAVRNIFSPDVRTAIELIVDQLAKAMGKDPYQFRREFVRFDRGRAVLDKVAQVGNWGRAMPAGTAQGIAIHHEYKAFAACLVEIDARPKTVNRDVYNAYTGPRVTKLVFAVDVGLPINPLGLQAQMMGGSMDGIAQALTYSLHLKDGHFLEGSWDDAFYTRQWNTPRDVQIIVMPPTGDSPGGAGELGVAASMAATACAYARAVGKMPTTFPINHDRAQLGFDPLPYVPPIPPSPSLPIQRARRARKHVRHRQQKTAH
jgi:isoquinoline 1-oxidoreductase beta subunit